MFPKTAPLSETSSIPPHLSRFPAHLHPAPQVMGPSALAHRLIYVPDSVAIPHLKWTLKHDVHLFSSVFVHVRSFRMPKTGTSSRKKDRRIDMDLLKLPASGSVTQRPPFFMACGFQMDSGAHFEGDT